MFLSFLLLGTFTLSLFTLPAHAHEHQSNRKLDSKQWFHSRDHPVHQLFRRDDMTTDGASYPEVGSSGRFFPILHNSLLTHLQHGRRPTLCILLILPSFLPHGPTPWTLLSPRGQSPILLRQPSYRQTPIPFTLKALNPPVTKSAQVHTNAESLGTFGMFKWVVSVRDSTMVLQMYVFSLDFLSDVLIITRRALDYWISLKPTTRPLLIL